MMVLQAPLLQQVLPRCLQQVAVAVVVMGKTAEAVAPVVEAVSQVLLVVTVEGELFQDKDMLVVQGVLITAQIMMLPAVAVVLVALAMITTLAVEQTAAMVALGLPVL
jgi:hypothetical protein